MTTLDALRIFGPISTAQLEWRVSSRTFPVHAEVTSLVARGLAEPNGDGRWDLTEKGRRAFQANLWARKRATEAAAQMTHRLWRRPCP